MVIPDGPYDDPANAYVPDTDDPDAADAMAEDEMLHEFDEKQKKIMVCSECGTRMFDFSAVTTDEELWLGEYISVDLQNKPIPVLIESFDSFDRVKQTCERDVKRKFIQTSVHMRNLVRE